MQRFVFNDLDESAVVEPEPRQEDVACALALGFVHQLVRALNQVRGETARDEAAIGDASQPQADDADVDVHGLHGQPAVDKRPVVAFDRLAEALADGVRLMEAREIRNQKAELVAAEPRVQVGGPRAEPLLREEVVGPDLFAQQRRDALDDPIAHCVADARPLALLVVSWGDPVAVDQWVEVEGVLGVREREGNGLVSIVAERVRPIAEPQNPYLGSSF